MRRYCRNSAFSVQPVGCQALTGTVSLQLRSELGLSCGAGWKALDASSTNSELSLSPDQAGLDIAQPRHSDILGWRCHFIHDLKVCSISRKPLFRVFFLLLKALKMIFPRTKGVWVKRGGRLLLMLGCLLLKAAPQSFQGRNPSAGSCCLCSHSQFCLAACLSTSMLSTPAPWGVSRVSDAPSDLTAADVFLLP